MVDSSFRFHKSVLKILRSILVRVSDPVFRHCRVRKNRYMVTIRHDILHSLQVPSFPISLLHAQRRKLDLFFQFLKTFGRNKKMYRIILQKTITNCCDISFSKNCQIFKENVCVFGWKITCEHSRESNK